MKQYRVFVEYDSKGKKIKEDVIVIEDRAGYKMVIIDFNNLTKAISWIKRNGKFACNEMATIEF